jgi:precorrin-8X/cobalt-precorrin-8 methylmutase
MIHACGLVEAAEHFCFPRSFVSAARSALHAGAPIFCDAEMVAHGVTRTRLPAKNDVLCTLHDPRHAELAKETGNTRSAAALHLWKDRLAGSVVAIGNAPTALFHLLELLRDGAPKPAAIIGMPVGFVGAAESKDALAENSYGVPFAIVRGPARRKRDDGSDPQRAGEAWPMSVRSSDRRRHRTRRSGTADGQGRQGDRGR